MTASSLIALLSAWVAVVIAPGPDLVQITRQATRSRAAGQWCALGVMAGNTIWITAALVGFAALLNTHPRLMAWLQLLGGGYLTYLGVRAVMQGWQQRSGARLRRRRPDATTTATTRVETSPQKPRATRPATTPPRAFLAGLATNLANPKALLFFAAIFAQFITPEMTWGVSVAVAALMIAVGIGWFSGFALAVRAVAGAIDRGAALIDLVTGALFCGIGGYMVFEGLGTLIGWLH